MKILLARPRGSCAGVVMAIQSLDRALELIGPPLYVFHEIVHNKHVVETYQRRGVIFVEDLSEVPQGSTLLYSAHGVSPAVRDHARQRRLRAIDATCPLVAKVHTEVVRYAARGFTIILVGHKDHDEVVGTLGEAPAQMRLVETVEDVDRLTVPDASKVAYVTQTTLSVDDARRIIERLMERFPQIVGPSKQDICYATQNRQDAVKALLGETDLVLVLGSKNSSNSNRLVEIARDRGKPAHLIDSVAELADDWFHGQETVLMTAGASAPEELVRQCVSYLQNRYQATVEEYPGREEHAYFPLPPELREKVVHAAPLSDLSSELQTDLLPPVVF